MSQNLNSTNVTVFPFGKTRPLNDLTGRLLSEANIARIIRLANDNDSYIISAESDGSKYMFEFVLHGYYFKITDVSPSKPLYAAIKVTSTDMPCLEGQDGVNPVIQDYTTPFEISSEGRYVFENLTSTLSINLTNDLKVYKSGDSYSTVEQGLEARLSENTITVTPQEGKPKNYFEFYATENETVKPDVQFTGLSLSDKPTGGANTFHLQLLDDSGSVPLESCLRSDSRSTGMYWKQLS